MKKRILFLVAFFAICLQAVNAQTGYGIKVNDTEITTSNAANLTFPGLSGTVTYNATSHVLTLNNVTANDLYFLSNDADVTVTFLGNCQFSRSIQNASGHKVTFLGTATDQLVAQYMWTENSGSDIELSTGIFRFSEDMSAGWGLTSYDRQENLILTNADVYVGGSTCAIDNWKSITLNNCEIVAPIGAIVRNGCVRIDNAEVANQVVHIAPIKEAKFYGIYINGTELSSYNISNFAIEGLTGVVTYNDSTKVLSLHNVNAESLMFSRNTSDVTVIYDYVNLSAHLYNASQHKVTFRGTDTSRLLSALFIGAEESGSDIELADGRYQINMDMINQDGIYGFGEENLTITNADVLVGGGSSSAISAWHSITLNDCEIVEPVGAVVEGGYVLLNGEDITNAFVHIAPTASAIERLDASAQPMKIFRNGSIYIRTAEGVFTTTGQKVE